MGAFHPTPPAYPRAHAPGDNQHHQLGVASGVVLAPHPLPGGPGGGCWASLCFGEMHAAGISGRGELYTWGLNLAGQLGQGDTDAVVCDTPCRVWADKPECFR